MAVTKISNSGIKTGVLKYDSMLAGNAAYDPAATWLIQRISPSNGTSSITFSSIPQTYQHLQIRVMAKDTYSAAASGDGVFLEFNSDTASNYVTHRLVGNGSTASAGYNAARANIIIGGASVTSGTGLTNMFGTGIIDIHDYTSTTKNKTVRSFSGVNANTSTTDYELRLSSGLWMSTSAITSIKIIAGLTAFASNSTFALYGFIGA